MTAVQRRPFTATSFIAGLIPASSAGEPGRTSIIVPSSLRACFETTRGAVFGEKAGWRGATKENIPGGSSTEEQRSQTAFSPKTLRAAGLLSVASVDSFLTAHCGDARNSPPWPPPKSLAAAPLVVSKQALGQNDLANHTIGWLYQSIRNVQSPSVGKGSELSLARGR